MENYKRIYEEDIDGNVECVGLIKKGETIKVVKDLTPQQKAIINNKKELNSHCKKLGGYIHVYYVNNKLLFHDLNLSQSTISRFLYLATYIDYNDREENVLIKYGQNKEITYLTKKDIKKIMKLSDKTFRDFYKEIQDKELLFEANNKVYLNPKYVNKGVIENNNQYTRMFINTTRELYDYCTPRQHKQLSYLYQLIPFIHCENNILCENPNELDAKKVNKLNFKEICKILGTSTNSKAMMTLKKDLTKFSIIKDNKKYYIFTQMIRKQGEKKGDFFIINPYVIWNGYDIEKAKYVFDICSM